MIEAQVLNYILNTKDYSIIVLNGIDSKYFPNYKQEFQFITDHYNKYGNVCDKETFVNRFNNWEFIDVLETKKYLLDSLVEEYVYNQAVPIIKRSADILTNGDSREAVDFITSKMATLNKCSGIEAVELYSDVEKRYEQYLDKVTNQKKYFITTGFAELDEVLGGWDKNEDFILIVARTNQGKSWWATKFANEAAIKDNITVGMYSGEMSEDKVGYRLDTINSNISNFKLQKGVEDVQQSYYQYAKDYKGLKNKFYVCTPNSLGGMATVAKLKAFVEKYNIELLVVDQYSLLKDANNAKNRNDRFEALSMELKLLQTQLKIPIMVVAQLNRSATGKDVTNPETDMIAGSDRIAQDATTIISLKQRENSIMELRIMKHRDGHVGDKLLYNWDADCAKFTYMPAEDDAKSGDTCEETHNRYRAADSDEPF